MRFRFLSGFTTIEVMVMLVAMSIVIFASYGAQQAAFVQYSKIINRERAQLYLAETMEELEAFRLTEANKYYINNWKNFLGSVSVFKDGNYQLENKASINSFALVSEDFNFSYADQDEGSGCHCVKVYDAEDKGDGFYTRLERHIAVSTDDAFSPDAEGVVPERILRVSVYWGVPGAFSEDTHDKIAFQAIYTDHTFPAFAL